MADGYYFIRREEEQTTIQIFSFNMDICQSYDFNTFAFVIGIDIIKFYHFALCTNAVAIYEVPG